MCIYKCVYAPTELIWLCSYVHVFGTNHLDLEYLCGSSCLQERDDSSVSNCLPPVALHLEVALCQISPVHIGMTTSHYTGLIHSGNHIAGSSWVYFSVTSKGPYLTAYYRSLGFTIFILPLI